MGKIIRIRAYNILIYIFCFLTFFLLYNPCFAQTNAVADVNGVVLINYDLQVSLNEIMPAGIFHGGFSSEKRASYRPEAIEKMIEKELLYQETLKRGMQADTKAIKKFRDKIIDKIGSLEKYKKVLKKNGLTDELYIRSLKKNEMAKKILKIEVDNKAEVSNKEALEYYKKNFKGFMRPETIKLRHILISVKPNASAVERSKLKTKAKQLLSRIKAGEDMAKLARDNSDDMYRIKGGDYGFIHRGRLDPELEKHIMKLGLNELSNVIETRFGYHIARVEAIRPPTQLSYEQVSEKIKIKLSKIRKKKLKKAFISQLRKNAEIIIY
ncbi:MAG: hypothetical protein GXP56_15305 [Deltaproteobacteria bacterium]|nr:hypothetical protein [Deltaproteobacteria bacterium]